MRSCSSATPKRPGPAEATAGAATRRSAPPGNGRRDASRPRSGHCFRRASGSSRARCFALAFSRQPSADELQTCLAHWRDIEALLGDARPASTKPPLEVRREAVEENTGEKFSFNERLHANAGFVPDLQPADVPAHTRALADVCLALLNSNEFAYVY